MTDTPGGDAPPTGSVPPPPPPPGRPPRRLVRSRRGGMIWGVAAGLGDYFQLDPVVFRILFVVLAFAGGAGILLYVVAALVLPGDDGSAPAVQDVVRHFERSRRHRWIGLALVIVAVALIVDGGHGIHLDVVWGLALIAVGVLLFEADAIPWRVAPSGPAPSVPPPPPASAAADEPVSSATAAAGSWSTPAWGGAARAGSAPGWTFPRRRRAGPPVGWITLALTLIAVGVAVMLGNAGVINLTVGSSLAIALVVIGAGTLVAAFVGRGRWLLILLGLLLVPAVFTGSVVDEPLSGGVGLHTFAPQSVATVDGSYTLAAGRLVLDLSDAQLSSAPRTVHMSVALGDLLVRVPDGVAVTVHGHVGTGHMDLLGTVQNGVQLNDTVSGAGSGDSGALTLDLDVGLGQLRVERVAAGALQ